MPLFPGFPLGRLGRKKSAQISAWQNAQSTLVRVGGVATMDEATALLANYTDICASAGILQKCSISQIKVGVHAASGANWKFKVFRYNSATTLYDFVAEQSFAPPTGTTGVQTYNIVPPIAVEVGDVPGLWCPVGNQYHCGYTRSAARSRYAAGEISTSNAFTDGTSGAGPSVQCYSTAPYLAVTGDSIPEGHNTATRYHGVEDDILVGTQPLPGVNTTAVIMDQLVAQVSSLRYQNLARGSQTFAWVASTGIVDALACKPHSVLIHCGVNDVAAARDWAAVDADLDTILAAVVAATPIPKLLIDEILPWTAGNDAQAGIIRTWNANLAIWCAANGATLVQCHNEMGQIRVATGFLDDLLTAYNQDNVHLTVAGVYRMAQIWKKYL